MTFAEMMKNGRETANIPLRIAAKRIGISIGYLNDLEHGRALRPKMKYIYAASAAYSIPVEELCIAAERIPTDVFYKIIDHPELIEIIRKYGV